jgi:hypothetical protein
MREILNQVLTVTTLVARNANKAMVALMAGSGGVFVWRESGVRWSVVLVRLAGIWPQLPLIFTHIKLTL